MKINWLPTKRGPAITIDSMLEIVDRVKEAPWPGSSPEGNSMNFYACGRAEMADEFKEKLEELKEKYESR